MKSYGRSKGRRRNVEGGEGFGLQRGKVRKRERRERKGCEGKNHDAGGMRC